MRLPNEAEYLALAEAYRDAYRAAGGSALEDRSEILERLLEEQITTEADAARLGRLDAELEE